MRHIALTSIIALSALCANAQGADEAYVFGYCGDIATSIGSGEAGIDTYYAAIKIPQELAETWSGSEMTGVNIGFGYSNQKEVTVYISETLESEPFYSQKATMSVQNGWNTVTLETPYEITGSAFVVGYSVAVNSPEEKPIGIDNIKTTENLGDWVNTYGNWESIGRFYGNVCLQLRLVGDNFPQYDLAATSVEVPQVVLLGQPFDASLNIVNNGLKTVNSVEVAISIADEAVTAATVTMEPLASGETGVITLSGIVSNAEGASVPMAVTVTKVNGEEDETPIDNTASVNLSCAAKTFKQNVLVEEFTGTWCGWCPMGIVGMAYMREKYGDDGFVGIAVHFSDEMAIEPYNSFAQEVTGMKAPSGYLDRRLFFLEPSSENLEELFLQAVQKPGIAGVEVSANYSTEAKTLTVTSSTQFSFDYSDAQYALAYVIKEDGVGPYSQVNYYSGGKYGATLEGWTNKPDPTGALFNEVARDIQDLYGIPGSVPSQISAGTPYEYSTELSLENVEDITKCEVVAMLLDVTTGEVVNCSQTSIAMDGAGVESLFDTLESGVIKVYTPQGLKVMETKEASEIKSLPQGIYIINGKKIKL